MATTVRETVPTETGNETPGIPRRRVLWLLIGAVIMALGIGLVAGAAAWQATRSDATAATRQLAERYIAADPVLHASRIPEFYAPNVVWVDATLGDIYHGRAGVQQAADLPQFPNMKIKATLVYAGPDTFIVDRRMRASSSPLCATPVSFPSVSVYQVKNGLITRETAWWDTSSAFHCTSTYPSSPTMPK